MGRLLKYLFILAVLAVLGLLGYSYSGLMEPQTRAISQPVTLDAN